MAIRLHAHWHLDQNERSYDEIGGGIAFNAWRIAKDKAITLHGEDFVYETDQQRFAVITEYLLFQLAITDRVLAKEYELDQKSRKKLFMQTVKTISAYLQDNALDIFGEGNYIAPFISKLNERGSEYAEFNFDKEGPSYPFYRHLGYEIQQIMGSRHENRWVIDQVMDKDGPDIYTQILRVIRGLF